MPNTPLQRVKDGALNYDDIRWLIAEVESQEAVVAGLKADNDAHEADIETLVEANAEMAAGLERLTAEKENLFRTAKALLARAETAERHVEHLLAENARLASAQAHITEWCDEAERQDGARSSLPVKLIRTYLAAAASALGREGDQK